MPSMIVMARVRPHRAMNEPPCIRCAETTCSFHDASGQTKAAFTFDDLFWTNLDSQEAVYNRSGALATDAVMNGLNACVFAYGQTGSGKTHTMLGDASDPGLIPLTLIDVFQRIEALKQSEPASKITVECSFFEVYNEKVRDLLSSSSRSAPEKPPKIRLHPTRGVFVDGLACRIVHSADEARRSLKDGMTERSTSSTLMNERSSRSHAVFQLVITKIDGLRGVQRSALTNLVDLAGSERTKRTGTTETRAVEARNINQSLSALRRVFDVLASNSEIKRHGGSRVAPVPFRDSVLTHVLSDSLGGNSYTLMFAMLSPDLVDADDTLSTLRYATMAKQIVVNPKVNEQHDSALLTRAMQDEIDSLRIQLTFSAGPKSLEDRNDIEGEIALREKEITKMSESHAELEKQIVAYREREATMREEVAQLHQRQTEMQTLVTTQQRERFAEAFRSAFRLSRKKNDVGENHGRRRTTAESDNEIRDLRSTVAALQRTVERLVTKASLSGGSLEPSPTPRLSPGKFVQSTMEDCCRGPSPKFTACQRCDAMQSRNEFLEKHARQLEEERAELAQREAFLNLTVRDLMQELWLFRRMFDSPTMKPEM
jgi:hypothetical protein